MKVLLATSNPGKVREVRAILAGSPLEVEVVPMWLGHEETGATYLENARAKAAAAARLSGAAALAEDAGLEVDGLGGAPGPRSARFAGASAGDRANNEKLIRLVSGLPAEGRAARYRAVAVLRLTSGREIVGEGTWEGRIIAAPRGSGGFGYDPLFVPEGSDQTGAELSADEKNAVSHRAQALRAIVDAL